MIRFLLLVLIVIGGYWAYNNVDMEQFKSSAINLFSKEKTIQKFNQADKMNKETIEDSLNSF